MMSEVLHSMPMPSGALASCLCVRGVAFDRDTARCTGEVVEGSVSDDCTLC